MTQQSCLVLRLAGPLQSWGSSSQFNHRRTDLTPTKSGIVGLLAAASGRRRTDPIEDLLSLTLGLRVDEPGSLLKDYHTVSDFTDEPLRSSAVNAKGRQKPTGPKKYTHVTQRYYLQDAVFVAVLGGPEQLMAGLAGAVRRPVFPLALGRRSCVPDQPILVPHEDTTLWPGAVREVLEAVPWQATSAVRRRVRSATVTVPYSLDDPHGEGIRQDLPVSFDPARRGMRSRPIGHGYATLATGIEGGAATDTHDPFALLGW